MEYIVSPEGAMAPFGVDKIEKGMSQEAVLRVMMPLYRVIHAADAEPSLPIADFFPYEENGQTKFIEVSYNGSGRVDWIRFGYTETFVLE